MSHEVGQRGHSNFHYYADFSLVKASFETKKACLSLSSADIGRFVSQSTYNETSSFIMFYPLIIKTYNSWLLIILVYQWTVNGCIINGLSVYHGLSTVCQELPDVPRFSLESRAKKAAIPISPVAHAPNAVENAVGRLRLEIVTAAQKWQAWNMRILVHLIWLVFVTPYVFGQLWLKEKRQYETLNPTLIDVKNLLIKI